MIVRSLEHAACEGPGSILRWVDAKGGEITRTRLYAGETVPDLGDADLLLLMGGPMSVNDHLAHPWLLSEIELIRTAMDRGVRVLGICLGAQLVARALGARVYPAAAREIGWHPVRRVDPGWTALPVSIDLFHWHGETFDLPPGAVLRASSETCANQIFTVGDGVVGIQCHPEMTPQGARDLVHSCPGDLAPGPWVQSAQRILAASPESYTRANETADRLLDHLMEG